MSIRQTDVVASDDNGSTTRKVSRRDAYDADDESDPEPTTLSDALQIMQDRMRSSELQTTTTAQKQGQHVRPSPQQGRGFGPPMPWTGSTIVDLRCSEPEKLWKPTYDTSQCTRPRDLNSKPAVSGQGMPSDTRPKPTGKVPAQQRTKGAPGNEQVWRAGVR